MKKLIYTIIFLFCFLPSIAFGANYYCDCSVNSGLGSGEAQGTFANPFESINDANDGPTGGWQTGDNLYFETASTCLDSETLNITWITATIGAYEAEGDFIMEGEETLPILDGNSMSNADYGGLIRKQSGSGALNITIENLHLYRSGAWGVYIDPDSSISGVTVDNCIIDSSWKGAIAVILWNGGSGVNVTDNILSRNAQINNQGASPTTAGANFGAVEIVGCGNCGTFTSSATDITISGNEIFYNTTSEIVHVWGGTDGAIIEKNTIYDNPVSNVSIYSQASTNQIIRYNLIYGTTYLDDKGGRVNGIGVTNEGYMPYCQTGGTKVYGNLIANMANGFYIGSKSGCDQNNNLIYNNTFVDNTSNIYIWSTAETGSGNKVQNNISWAQSRGSHTNNCDASGWTWGYNLWSSDPGGGTTNCDNDANDPANASPGLSKASGWTNLPSGEVAGWQFEPTANSPATNGTALNIAPDGVEYVLIPGTLHYDDNPPTATAADADDYAWPYGAILGGLTISVVSPTDTQLCGQTDDVTPETDVMTISSGATNANCNHEDTTCDGETYATLADGAMSGGEGGTTHTQNVSTNCGTNTTWAVICKDADDIESNCVEINHTVALSGGEPPQPGMNIDVGGTVSITTGGTVSIE